MPQTNDVDFLFHLVHRLDRTEKRAFRQAAQARQPNGKSLQWELFEAVNAQSEPDEHALRAQFSNRLSPHQLSAAKNRLHRRLLRVLCDHHTSADPVAKLRQGTQAVRILIEKGLPRQAFKLLLGLDKQARKRDDWSALLTLNRLRQHLIPSVFPRNPIPEALAAEQRHRELALCLAQEESLVASLELLQAMTGRSREFDPTLFTEQAELAAPPRSFLSAMLQTQIRGVMAFANRNHTAARMAYAEASADWEDRPELIPLHPDLYLRYQLNRLNTTLTSQQPVLFQQVLNEVKRQLPRLPVSFIHQLRIHYLELVFCLNYGNRVQGQALMEAVGLWLQEYPGEQEKPRMLALYHNAAVFHFLHGEWRPALKFVNRIRNLPRNQRQLAIQGFAPILELVLHYALDNWDYLENRLRALLREPDRLPEYYLEFCRSMKTAIGLPDQLERRACWKHLLEHLHPESEGESTSGKPRKVTPTGSQELHFWLRAQVDGVGIGEVYRKALAQRGI